MSSTLTPAATTVAIAPGICGPVGLRSVKRASDHVEARHLAREVLVQLEAVHLAVVALLELVAAQRVVEQEREVRVEIELVVDEVRAELGGALLVAAAPFGRDTRATRIAAVARVQRAEA